MGSSADPATDAAVLRCLAAARRRQVLRLLRDRAAPVGENTLARALAARERDDRPADVTRDAVRDRLAALRHDHLPRLAAADLVAWDRDDGTVAATGHPALDRPALGRVVANPDRDWDAVLETLADDRRRAILSVLRDRDGVVGRAELAAAIVARERNRERDDDGDGDGTGPGTGAGADVGTADRGGNDAVLSLHHVHLPKLERAGLLAYDAEAGTVSYQGDGTLADDLLDGGSDGADERGSSAATAPGAHGPSEGQ